MLSQDLIHETFTKHRSFFGGIFNTAMVLWAFLSQVLRDGQEASCQSAVARVSAFLAAHKKRLPDSNTGDYCKARAKLSEHALKGWHLSIVAEHQRAYAAQGMDIEVQLLRSVDGKAAARGWGSRYIETYMRVFGKRPPNNPVNH